MNSNDNKTPLEYYERAIQELTNTREQLQTELESLKALKDELKSTQNELATTQAKLDDTQRELSNTKQELQQKTEPFEKFSQKIEAGVNYCYSNTQDVKKKMDTELETLRKMQASYQTLKDELATTQAKLDDTQRELSNTKQELQKETQVLKTKLDRTQTELSKTKQELKQETEPFKKLSDKIEAQVNYCYSETQDIKNHINSLTSDISARCLSLNYRKLKYFLENKMWKEADEETFKKLLELAGREKEGKLVETDLNLLFSEDLRTIDRLWIKYSDGHFGFSIQTKIYHRLKNTQQKDDQIWNAFGEKVGWCANNIWLWYKSVNFSTSAPSGHLPARIWDNWNQGGVGSFKPLLSRLIDCGI